MATDHHNHSSTTMADSQRRIDSQDDTPCQDGYPQKADLRRMMVEQPLPSISPSIIDRDYMTSEESTQRVRLILGKLNTALAFDDYELLESCFFSSQVYWKDELALTYHLRTFTTPGVIAASLLETIALRQVVDGFAIDGEAHLVSATSTLVSKFAFRTRSPAATCSGRMVLIPVTSQLDSGNYSVEWKIWILSTSLENLDLQHEDEALLYCPARPFEHGDFDTDVFIIGGGNAAISLAARLKAFGVESVMAERNAKPGDNWALRYDCMRFHTPTSYCDLPYMPYDKELRTPHLLRRNELTSQVRRYVETFNLNFITSAQIKSTQYDPLAKRWTVMFQAPSGQRTATSKHLVLATGIGCQKLNMPSIADSNLYQGISIHSTQFKNGKHLKEQGAKSVLVIGSANTAFDVLQDCHDAGIQTTMVIRNPPYLVPAEYVSNKNSVGAYDLGVAAADRHSFSLPLSVCSHLDRGVLAGLAAQEPDRYASLAATGFPVFDSSHPDAILFHNLIERMGGHYIDVGGTRLIADGKTGIKAGVEPVAYTTNGLRFSDGSYADADAIVWCTGYADQNARDTTAETLGGGPSLSDMNEDKDNNNYLLGPREIAARMDATWGIDNEGEVRGMWKRHLRLDDNFWIMGGYTQQHRWYSRALALQIKAKLEGVLPSAYRDTPCPRAR